MGFSSRLSKNGLAYGGLAAVAAGFVLVARHFARRGDWAGSLVATILALVVGMYMVLRLWPQFPRPGLSYQLTRHGVFYIFAVLAVAVGALSSANNLLFLVLACMLGALLVSGLFSRLNLAELELQCSVPEEIFAGQDVPVRLSLRNLKTRMPSFAIWLRADIPGVPAAEVYFPMLAAGKTSPVLLNLCFPRRGQYQQDTFWLRSGFPFGFLVRSMKLRLRREILVYPAVRLTPDLETLLPQVASEWEAYRAGLGQDLYRIRPYQTGDSSRVVHWKASAHTGELKVREFSVEEDRRLEIWFDRAVPRGVEWREKFERAIELCASLAWRLHNRGARLRFQPGALEDIYDILRYLALVEPVEGGPALRVDPSGMFQVIFAASSGSFSLPPSSYYFYALENL